MLGRSIGMTARVHEAEAAARRTCCIRSAAGPGVPDPTGRPSSSETPTTSRRLLDMKTPSAAPRGPPKKNAPPPPPHPPQRNPPLSALVAGAPRPADQRVARDAGKDAE